MKRSPFTATPLICVHTIAHSGIRAFIADAYAALAEHMSGMVSRQVTSGLAAEDLKVLRAIQEHVLLVGDPVPVSDGTWIVHVAPRKDAHRQYDGCETVCNLMQLIAVQREERRHAARS